MNSFISDFYIGQNLHRIEVLASPFKSSQKIYVDNRICIDFKGTLVNGYMFYEIPVENVPLIVSIRDCGFCCECNIFLDNTSIIDGSKLDYRKIQAQKNIDEGFGRFVQKNVGKYIKRTVPFALLYLIMNLLMAGFDLMSLCAAFIAYPACVIFLVLMGWSRQRTIVEKWYHQFQQWQVSTHNF